MKKFMDVLIGAILIVIATLFGIYVGVTAEAAHSFTKEGELHRVKFAANTVIGELKGNDPDLESFVDEEIKMIITKIIDESKEAE